jgi:copper(I)-binding protein
LNARNPARKAGILARRRSARLFAAGAEVTRLNRAKRRWLSPVLLAALCAACGARAPARIELSGQRAALFPALLGACSVFMSIANAGDGEDALVGAAVELPGTVTEIHDVRDGKMVRSERVVVPARGAVELRPGGLHIMVFKLPREVGAGSELRLRLRFEASGEKVTSVQIGG